jgi:hypothetical protein
MRHRGEVFVVDDLHGLWMRDARGFEKVPVLDSLIPTGKGSAVNVRAGDKPRAGAIQ